MQGPTAMGAPAANPSGTRPKVHPYRQIGGLLLFFAIVLCGVGGALASYCVTDDYGLCYYPDAGAGFALIGLGILALIVGIVLMAVGRTSAAPIVPPMSPAPASPLYYSPGTAPAGPAYTLTLPPPLPPSPPAPGAARAPYCALCGQPTTYNAQYGRYYCFACRRYA